MSKKVGAQLICPECGHGFPVQLFRSVWIEQPEHRELIFSDKINRFDCPSCRSEVDSQFAFLCTNVPKRVAVWYEPYPDPQIDRDVAGYRTQMGANSFYALAPRISDWEAFKSKIVELEAQPSGGGKAPTFSGSLLRGLMGMTRKR